MQLSSARWCLALLLQLLLCSISWTLSGLFLTSNISAFRTSKYS